MKRTIKVGGRKWQFDVPQNAALSPAATLELLGKAPAVSYKRRVKWVVDAAGQLVDSETGGEGALPTNASTTDALAMTGGAALLDVATALDVQGLNVPVDLALSSAPA